MSLKQQRARDWLTKRTRKPKKDFPLVTVAFYGPTNTVATKLAAALILWDGAQPDELETWELDSGDVRTDPHIQEEMVSWMRACEAQRVVIADGILGCPHQEGIDYPEGQTCHACPFWANRDRFTGQVINEPITHEVPMTNEDPMPTSEVELIYSPHCQTYVHDGVTLQLDIYTGVELGWTLEVTNERGTATVWSDLFDDDDAAYAEFIRTLNDEGVSAFEGS